MRGIDNLESIRKALLKKFGFAEGVSRGISLECHAEYFGLPFRTEVVIVDIERVAKERDTTEKKVRDWVMEVFKDYERKLNKRYLDPEHYYFTVKKIVL